MINLKIVDNIYWFLVSTFLILFNDSLMIDCLRWVLEDIKEAIFFLPSNRLATLLLSKDALKGLVT